MFLMTSAVMEAILMMHPPSPRLIIFLATDLPK